MRRGLRHAASITLLSAVALVCAPAAPGAADTAGTVHFVRSAASAFNPYTNSPSPAQQAWLRAHMWRMMVWSPYFDERTSWYPQGWLYDDAYAIYAGSQLAAAHPSWILRDGSGNKLYIPFGCSGGSCPQYAGDISNPEFRHNWIEEARARLAHSYRGLFVDDVNMEERTGNGEGGLIPAIGFGSSGAISAAAWRGYMAEFMAEVRAAFPAAEIVHNALWFANSGAGPADPSIRREIESANWILIERGVNDSGLTGGNGQWSLNALFSYVDAVHALGRSVVMDGSAGDAHGMEYNLASYFLVSNGNDAVSGHEQTPENWWTGFDVNLGEATGPRYAWGNLLRRDFTGGLALVNPPGAATQTVSLPGSMVDTSGNPVTSVTLPAASGAVLRGAVAPPAAPAPGQAPADAPTQTTLQAAVIRSYHVNKKAHRRWRRHSRRRTRPRFHHRLPKRRAHAAAHRRVPASQRYLLTRISGVVRRASRGTVSISIDVLRGRRWVAARRVSVTVTASGTFIDLLRLRGGTRYRVLATYSGASGYRPSRSGYRVIALPRR